MRTRVFAVTAAILLSAGCATVQNTVDATKKMAAGKEAGASVRIISPANGTTVSSPVTVQFGLAGMGVAPAGTDRENTGHHHLIIDAKLPDLSLPVPASDNYLHFGGGQTQASIDLEPGTHTLQLLMGNYLHFPHAQPIYSEQITITVE